MARYLDPKADIVFKKIFGEHPKLLISFLNALLPIPEDSPIVELAYLSSEQIPVIPDFKSTIADVKCIDAKGRVFIVEMQMNWTDTFKRRLLFGTSQALVKQLERGEDYKLMQPVYGLGLIGEIFDKASPDWYHHYQLVKSGESVVKSDVIEHLQLIFIEIPKFPVRSPDEKKLRLLWLRFMREINEKTKKVSQELLDIPEIAEAIELAEEAAYTEGELDVYESYWDSVSREKTLISDNFDKGMVEGKAEGEAEGEAEGRVNEKVDVAINMLKDDEPLYKIIKYTGLSEDAITKLKNEMR